MEVPQSDPVPTPASNPTRARLDIDGRVFDGPEYFNGSLRNSFCVEGPRREHGAGVGRCVLGYYSHNIPHSCDETGKVRCRNDVTCTFTCSSRARLTQHLARVHDRDETFDCTVPGCKRVGERAFTRKDNLTQHIRKVHKRFIPRVKSRFGTGYTVIDEHPQDPRLGTFELAEAPSEAVGGDDTSAGAAEYYGGEGSFAFRKVQEEDYEL